MTATPQHPGWIVQLAVHRAVRRDTARLSAALAAGQEVSREDISVYWAETAVQLHHHHELEDTVAAPLMAERLGGRFESLVVRNRLEHQAMAAAMGEFDKALGPTTFEISAARDALARMQEAIETHLGHEEADVLPLIPEAFTVDDFAFFQAESAKTNPAHAFLPWVLDEAPETDLAFFTARMPAAVLEQLESNWMPRRRATADALKPERTLTPSGLTTAQAPAAVD